MTIDELKTILRITNSTRDDQLKFMLQAGIELAKEYCGDPFLDEKEELNIPNVVKVGIAKFVEVALQTANVQSERIEGMQRTFFSEDATKAAKFFWRLYRKVGYY